MTDSVQVFPPGFRVTDANDDPVSGAVIYFYDAGTSTSKTVYSDSGLSTAIGTSVTCDSSGVPSSGGNPVLVYVGTAAYKVVIKTSTGVTLQTLDNVKGAVTASSGSAVVQYSIDATSSSTITLTSADYGHIKECDITSASITATLPLASTCANQIFGIIRKGTVSGNTLTLAASGSDTVAGSSSVTLTKENDCLIVASNGATGYKLISFGRKSHLSGITADDLAAGVGNVVGEIKDFAFETVPSLWKECDGSAISRTTYANLFAAIGTSWGQGDGSTTFNLPDFRGRVRRTWDHAAGTDPDTAALSVTGAVNNGSGLIRLTVASTASLRTGQKVTVASVGGVSAATGTWTITVISTTTFDLQSSTFSGTYTSGGTVNRRYAEKTGGNVGDHVGTYQSDMLRSHLHSYDNGFLILGNGVGSPGTNSGTIGTYVTASTGGNETRMTNAAVLTCIYAGV